MSPELHINLTNLQSNIHFFRRIIKKNTELSAVVKADAYGHGMIEICNLLSDNGIDGFCVALLEEAIEIRKNNINEDKVWDALQYAQLEELVADLPFGLNTKIGENGIRLSGGE